MNLPHPGATANVKSNEDWRAIFSAFSHIVLIANSDAIDMAAVQREYPDTALFVFFNKVYKVLGKPFAGHALLISRAQPKGANIVYRGEVADVVKLLAPERFLGIMNVRLHTSEKKRRRHRTDGLHHGMGGGEPAPFVPDLDLKAMANVVLPPPTGQAPASEPQDSNTSAER